MFQFKHEGKVVALSRLFCDMFGRVWISIYPEEKEKNIANTKCVSTFIASAAKNDKYVCRPNSKVHISFYHHLMTFKILMHIEAEHFWKKNLLSLFKPSVIWWIFSRPFQSAKLVGRSIKKNLRNPITMLFVLTFFLEKKIKTNNVIGH